MIRNRIFHPRPLRATSRLIFCMYNARPESCYGASKIGELLFCPFSRQLSGFLDVFDPIKRKNLNTCQFTSM